MLSELVVPANRKPRRRKNGINIEVDREEEVRSGSRLVVFTLLGFGK